MSSLARSLAADFLMISGREGRLRHTRERPTRLSLSERAGARSPIGGVRVRGSAGGLRWPSGRGQPRASPASGI